MRPIVTVHSFNDAYAELAAVSMTTLVRSTKRDCDIHIFENSVSEGAMAKILSIQGNHPNAGITVHHIPDSAFAEVADERWGKETWYPLLAPEILGGLDRALVLEPDTLVCRDISDLFDMELGGSPLACHFVPASGPQQLATGGKPLYFNAGVLLFNVGVLRESGVFGMERIIEATHAIRLRCADDSLWAAQESYLNYTFDHGTLANFHPAYNLTPFMYMLAHQYAAAGTDELCEAVSNPAIIHFTWHKPNTKFYVGPMVQLRKWWDCHALSPFADPKRDAERLEEIIGFRSNMENAIGRLKRFKAEGTKIVFYGAGVMGTMFARIARSMGLSPDKVCDLNKRGATADGQPIEPPDALRSLDGGAIAVIAIAEPRALAEAKNALLALGFPENRILPVFEQPAPGGGATSWIP